MEPTSLKVSSNLPKLLTSFYFYIKVLLIQYLCPIMNGLIIFYRVLIDSYQFAFQPDGKIAMLYKHEKRPVILYPYGQRVVIFSTKDKMQQVFNSPVYLARMSQNWGLKKLGMLNNGIVWNDHPVQWKNARLCLQKGLNTFALKSVVDSSEEICLYVMETMVSKSSNVNMLDSLRWIALNFTRVNILGLEREKHWEKAKPILDIAMDYFGAAEFFKFRPAWVAMFLLPRMYAKYSQAIIDMHVTAEELLQEYERNLATKDLTTKKTPCALDHMYQMYMNDPASENQRHRVVQFLVESLLSSLDTSSVTMFYCLANLVENQEIYNKVVKEVVNSAAEISTKSLPYLQACLKESMRTTPVAPLTERKALADGHIDDTFIAKGDHVILNLVSMHRRAENSKIYDPSRFLDSNGGLLDHDDLPFGFFPFGGGKKGCVGRFLAMYEMQSTLYHILRNYDIKRLPENSLKTMEKRHEIVAQPKLNSQMTMIVIRR